MQNRPLKNYLKISGITLLLVGAFIALIQNDYVASINPIVIFLPLLAHVLLVFALYIKLGKEKTKALQLGNVDPKTVALDPKAWPESVVKISNNIDNQFQTPVIFYALIFAFFLTDTINTVVFSVFSIYVLSRIIHTNIHISSNYVPYRFKAFLVGILLLLGLTVWLIFHILTSL